MTRRRRFRLLRTVVVLVGLVVVSHLVMERHARGGTSNSAGRVQIVSSTPMNGASRHITDPFTQPAVAAYLSAHPGMTATIHDLANGKVWTYQPGRHDTAASIMKLDILETVLREDGVLSGDDLANATGMIENSSNDDAQDLWNGEGGAAAVSGYNERAGLGATRPNQAGYWGLSTTTASDQVRLLDHLALPNPVLSTPERRQALSLMHQVELDQRWGVGAGLPPGTPVAVKNGWLPLDNGKGWQVNSDGIVAGHGYRDDVSVLTTGEPTESAGIHEIEGLTRLVWPLLSPTGDVDRQ